jgi:hypothetical protein
MPVNDPLPDSESLADLPTFGLSYDVEDRENPTQVTVYAERLDEISTRWLTIDIAHAVGLTDIV